MMMIDDEENDNNPINIVEIPPERVDELSDNEDIDDDILDNEEPSGVPGMIEIHRSVAEKRVVALDPSSNTGATASAAANSTVSPPTKKRTLTLRAKWKRQPSVMALQVFLSPQSANPQPSFNFLNLQPQARNWTFKSLVRNRKSATTFQDS